MADEVIEEIPEEVPEEVPEEYTGHDFTVEDFGAVRWYLDSPLRFTALSEYTGIYDMLMYIILKDTTGKRLDWAYVEFEFGENVLEWTPPISWAIYNTTGTILRLDMRLCAWENVEYVEGEEPEDAKPFYQGYLIKESGNLDVPVYIPNNTYTVPKISIVTGDYTDNRETFGAYISGKSKPYMDFTIRTAFGATITNLELKILNHSHVSSGFWLEQDEQNPEKYSGRQDFEGNDGVIYSYCTKVDFEINITDSRGFTARYTLEEPSYQYSYPVISSLIVRRCNSSGTLTPSGSYLRVDFAASISPLGNNNAATYTLRYKRKDGNYSYNTISMTSYNGSYSVSGYKVFFATTTASYDVEMTATDAYSTTTRTTIGLSISKFWSALKNGLGFAFGKIAEKANTLDMGWAIYMNNNKIHGLTTPNSTDEAANKGYVDTQKTEANSYTDSAKAECKTYTDNSIAAIPNPYPVGAIYLSTSSTSPASLFGGTWERIQDRFLLAAGSSYTAGRTGGSATHTLTIAEMPSHSHLLGMSAYTVFEPEEAYYSQEVFQTGGGDYITNSVGSGDAHNNMPPYLVVYMWKRTE